MGPSRTSAGAGGCSLLSVAVPGYRTRAFHSERERATFRVIAEILVPVECFSPTPEMFSVILNDFFMMPPVVPRPTDLARLHVDPHNTYRLIPVRAVTGIVTVVPLTIFPHAQASPTRLARTLFHVCPHLGKRVSAADSCNQS